MRSVALITALLSLSAYAADQDVLDAQKLELENLRTDVAGQIQLQAFDLVDELVYGWTQEPPFGTETAVVLADVNVPVGFGTGLQALIETHFAGVITRNRNTHVILTHCPACTSLIVHSDKTGTIVSRGVDQPDALIKVGAETGSLHALFLDFEAEGASLVLRARITALKSSLPIVYARTLSSSISSASLLRTGDRLKSATEARQEYLDTLLGRGNFVFPVRIGIRTYAKGNDAPIASLPYIWLQAGAEVALTQARVWTASVTAGVTYFPQVHSGYLFQGRVGRLLTGSTQSLTHPDLYAYVGGAFISISGPGAATFKTQVPTVVDLLAAATNTVKPEATFAAFQLGLDLRVKNRIGVGVYLEAAPGLDGAPAIGTYLDLILKFHSFGAEVSVCF
jgi:hypothetical protein